MCVYVSRDELLCMLLSRACCLARSMNGCHWNFVSMQAENKIPASCSGLLLYSLQCTYCVCIVILRVFHFIPTSQVMNSCSGRLLRQKFFRVSKSAEAHKVGCSDIVTCEKSVRRWEWVLQTVLVSHHRGFPNCMKRKCCYLLFIISVFHEVRKDTVWILECPNLEKVSLIWVFWVISFVVNAYKEWVESW